MNNLIKKLRSGSELSKDELICLINCDENTQRNLCAAANEVRLENYSNKIFIRGLIEFTNICSKNCLYCGIRRDNLNCERYRLSEDEILACCDEGYELGFRTFVLQGGEDGYFDDDRICSLIEKIKGKYPDCALTLSIGEKPFESYKKYFDSGADRYLLRHETANLEHYAKLHTKESYENRVRCLWNLKKIGYQVGCGFMVGSPYQTVENLAEDLIFIRKLNPQMVGLGPFIHHGDTPFADFPDGTLELTLRMLALVRLTLPKVLLPATTALASIHPKGREMGILAGANVVMPNLSPLKYRESYKLYENKACTGDESAQCLACLSARMKSIDCEIVTDRGDSKNI